MGSYDMSNISVVAGHFSWNEWVRLPSYMNKSKNRNKNKNINKDSRKNINRETTSKTNKNTYNDMDTNRDQDIQQSNLNMNKLYDFIKANNKVSVTDRKIQATDINYENPKSIYSYKINREYDYIQVRRNNNKKKKKTND